MKKFWKELGKFILSVLSGGCFIMGTLCHTVVWQMAVFYIIGYAFMYMFAELYKN